MEMDASEGARRIGDMDHQFVWHPFTQMRQWADEDPLVITEGRGCYLKEARGRWYLDGVSSLWVNIHGHRKAELDNAIKAQLDKIAHTTMLGLTNDTAVSLAARLAGLLDDSLGPFAGVHGNPLVPSRVFYSDNGSTAVEVALKMAFQYWQHKGVEGRHKFIALNNAYHGDTIGAVSVGGVDIFHSAFGPLLFKTHKGPSPFCYRCELGHTEPAECGMACLHKVEDLLKAHAHECAAFIIEPLMQAAGGMLAAPAGYLRGVRELCTRYDVLLIADEVATGFGRTGRMLACEHESVVPDIICLSKGITGGYMPLAVTIATDEIYSAFLGEFRELKTFFHGHSYTGNPLGCACALACLDIFEREETIASLAPKVALMQRKLQEISGHGNVGNVRSVGLMAAVELVRDKHTREPFDWEEKMGWKVTHALMDRGVIIRPLGNVLVLMPPLVITEDEMGRMMDAVSESIAEVLPPTP